MYSIYTYICFITFLVFLYHYFLTFLLLFAFFISFSSFYTFLSNHLLQVSYNYSSVVHLDLKNQNAFFKKTKCIK